MIENVETQTTSGPTELAEAIQRPASGIRHAAILYDGRCSLCMNSIKLVKKLDWLHRFVFRDLNLRDEIARDYPNLDASTSLEEMHVILPGGRRLSGFFAFREIARNLPLGWPIWPLLYVPGVPYFGVRVYRFVARNRSRNGFACEIHAKP
jgi:predicted DCC family thiol-disulfide oxidoreductase YuxK